MPIQPTISEKANKKLFSYPLKIFILYLIIMIKILGIIRSQKTKLGWI